MDGDTLGAPRVQNRTRLTRFFQFNPSLKLRGGGGRSADVCVCAEEECRRVCVFLEQVFIQAWSSSWSPGCWNLNISWKLQFPPLKTQFCSNFVHSVDVKGEESRSCTAASQQRALGLGLDPRAVLEVRAAPRSLRWDSGCGFGSSAVGPVLGSAAASAEQTAAPCKTQSSFSHRPAGAEPLIPQLTPDLHQVTF